MTYHSNIMATATIAHTKGDIYLRIKEPHEHITAKYLPT